MKENTIVVYGDEIEALENGKIAINGKEIDSIAELENTVNILMKAVISLVQSLQ